MSGGSDREKFDRSEFAVYSPSRSVGVTCDGRGRVVGLTLSQDAVLQGEIALAEEIVALAGLARAKSRMGLRLHSMATVATEGPAAVEGVDRFCREIQKLPTPGEYREMEAAEFGRLYPDTPRGPS